MVFIFDKKNICEQINDPAFNFSVIDETTWN